MAVRIFILKELIGQIQEAREILESLGLNMTEAIRMFLVQVVMILHGFIHKKT